MRAMLVSFVIVGCTFLLQACSDGSDSRYEAAVQFSYSVLTNESGRGLDLLEELNSSVLPELTRAGAQEYGIWSWVPESSNEFDEIAEDKLVVMLRWGRVDTSLLADEFGAMSGVSDVTTSLWEVILRGGEGPIETGPGFYIHRFDRYLSEDIDQVLSLTEQAWVTWEPFWGGEVIGVWRDLDEVDEANGITRLMRMTWYRDLEHWQETREFLLEPDSFELMFQREVLGLERDAWSANLQPH
jgi:hypothetical protein